MSSCSFRSLNEDTPESLLQPGTRAGNALHLDLDSLEQCAQSRFANVFKVKSTTLPGLAALKVVFAPNIRAPHNLRREASLLARCEHENLETLFNAYHVSAHYILATPFYPVPLTRLLDDASFTPDSEEMFLHTAKTIVKHMCQAVAHLHEMRIAHRDISSGNWMISDDGLITLIDLGVAYDTADPGQEGTHNMEFELGTGAHRAPELLFGSRSYSPFALDRWSLGTCIASLFTKVGRTMLPQEWGENKPEYMRMGPIRRSTLFESDCSDFTLVASIFKILGTPTLESWPQAEALPDFGKFTYKHFDPIDLATVLPNLPPSSGSGCGPDQLISLFLKYPFDARLKAGKALEHDWLHDAKSSVDVRRWL